MQPNQFSIRAATSSDAHAIWDVHTRSIRQVASRDYTPVQLAGWSDHLTAEGYVSAMEQGEVMFVAILDDKVIGFSSVKGASIMAVYVAPDGIGFGVGKALYQKLEAHAVAIGVAQLELDSSITAVGFYQKLGYTEISRKVHVTGSGAELPCVRMLKRL